MSRLICILLTIIILVPMCIFTVGAEPEQMLFSDVKENHWYYNAVKYCYENRLLNGMSENRFGVNEKITREMFVKALGNLAGIDESEYADKETPFSDVKKGQWYYAAIEWARQNNIVSGMTETSFGRGRSLSREQMARLFCQYAKYMNKDISEKADYSSFSDVESISEWAEEGMNYAIAKSFIMGSNGKLEPGATATRAQLAVVLMKFHRFYSRRIVCWGDSLTMGVIDCNDRLVERSYPQTIEDITGIETINYGVGGDTSEQIAMRQGSIEVSLYATDAQPLTIPAGCEPVRVEPVWYSEEAGGLDNCNFGTNGMRGVNPIRVAGIEGTIEYGGDGNLYYFTRTEAGEELTLTESEPIATFASVDKKDTDINVLYIGNNNKYAPFDSDYESLLSVQRKMLEFSGSDSYVIVGFTSPLFYMTGAYDFNNRMAVTYPANFANPRPLLCDPQYLRSRGVTVTNDDLAQIARNEVPQCMIHPEDQWKLHGSQLYYDIVGEVVAEKILELYD